MKNQVRHTIIPLTGVLLLLCVSLQVMLHLRQKAGLQKTSAFISSNQAILKQADALQQAWSAQIQYTGRHLFAQQTPSYDGLQGYQQNVANAILQLRHAVANNEIYKQQLHRIAEMMMHSESIAASISTAPGMPNKAVAHKAMLQQSAQPVFAGFTALKMNIYRLQQEEMENYLTAQKGAESIAINSLLILGISLAAFLYFIYQDYRALRNQQNIPAPLEQGGITFSQLQARPAIPVAAKPLGYRVNRSAYFSDKNVKNDLTKSLLMPLEN